MKRHTEISAAKLKEVINQSGRKMSWIAEQLGVDRSTVTRWMNGKYAPSYTAIKLLAQILEVEVEDFELKAA